jgi:uncharacterized protein
VVVLLGGILGTHYFQNHSKVISACGLRGDENVQINSHKLTVQVASTPQAQTRGLGGLLCISSNEGMLFVFDNPGQYKFWMKDMRFPIDMIWISSGHKAVVVEEDVLPSTYHSKNPFFINPQDKPAQYVLELKAHASTVLNINPGTAINF